MADTTYQQFVSGTPPGSLWEQSRRITRQLQQDRAHELKMRELEYLAGRKMLGLDIDGAGTKGTGASEFLQQWQDALGESKGVYNQALSAMKGSLQGLRTAEGAAAGLGDLAGRIETEYHKYVQEMAPLQQEMTSMAGEEADVRRQLLAQFPALASYDPEAAAGRAISDVASQAGMQRQAEARRLAALGIDPTSQRGMAASRGMAGQEALGRALAAGQARQQERLRAGQLTGQGLSLIDPTRSAEAAMAIRRGANELMGMSAGLLGQQASTLGNLATTRAGIGRDIAGVGTAYAQNIAAPIGEMAGIQMGMGTQGQAVDYGNVLQTLQNRSPLAGTSIGMT